MNRFNECDYLACSVGSIKDCIIVILRIMVKSILLCYYMCGCLGGRDYHEY